MSKINRALFNTTILYGKLLITTVISFVSVRLLLRALGEVDYGIYNLISGVTALLLFLNNAMVLASNRFISCAEGSETQETRKQIFNMSWLLHTSLAALVFICFMILAVIGLKNLLNLPPARVGAANWVFATMVFSVCASIISVPYDAVIAAKEELWFFALAELTVSIGKLLAAMAMCRYDGDRLVGYACLFCLLTVSVVAGKYLFCRRHVECRLDVRRNLSADRLKKMLSFAGWTLVGSSSNVFAAYGKGIILNHFFGVLINAAEGVAMQVSGQLLSFSGSFFRAVNPVIMKSESRGDDKFSDRVVNSSSRFSVYLFALFAVPVLLEAPLIFRLWLHKVPAYAVMLCELTIVRSFFAQMGMPLVTLITAQGDIARYQIYEAANFILFLFLSVVGLSLLPRPELVYYLLQITIFIQLGIRLYFAHRNCGFDIREFFLHVFGKIAIGVLVCIGMGWAVRSVMPDGLPRLAAIVAVCMFTLGIYILTFGTEDYERRKIRQLFDRLRGVALP